MRLKLLRPSLIVAFVALALLAGPAFAAGAKFSPGKVVGLPLIGGDDRPLGDIDDVLIGYNGKITDFVVNLTGGDREGQRVRVPWADVTIERDPLQVKLSNADQSYTRYPGRPRGTLGDINEALITMILGAPAKTRFGEHVGEVVSLGATADGQIVDVVLSKGGSQVPLPWDFVEIRPEKSTFPAGRNVEAVVVVDRPH